MNLDALHAYVHRRSCTPSEAALQLPFTSAFGDQRQSARLRAALFGEQGCLALHAPAISRQASILLHHAMARDHQRNWIGSACVGHRAYRFRTADGLGDFSITARFSGWDAPESVPHQLLKRRALNVQRDVA